jgi:hypothetical protein
MGQIGQIKTHLETLGFSYDTTLHDQAPQTDRAILGRLARDYLGRAVEEQQILPKCGQSQGGCG